MLRFNFSAVNLGLGFENILGDLERFLERERERCELF